MEAEETGEKLSGEELVPFCTLLLVAGNETTTNLISNAMYSILETPDVYNELRSHPELTPQAVEEALRFRAPAPVLRRIAKRDTEIGDTSLKKVIWFWLLWHLQIVMKRSLTGHTCLIFTAILIRISRLDTASIFVLGHRLPVLKQRLR